MQQTTITELRARRIWDSRGRPTIEAQVQLADGCLGLGQAPAGASTGRHEALELRDGDDDPFLGGLDVQTAIRQCDALIRPMLIGQQA
ncbi:MAG: phosphopyruvate hydratase, partial [Betaproteobacteria bacterium]|nr:phosphopyruvate hydratase [Betaproteobacteria bacterium]